MSGKWWLRAACKGHDLTLFFPRVDKRNRYTAARRICAACPVQAECLQDAIDGDVAYGMWGGLTPFERGWHGPRRVVSVTPGLGHGDAKGTVRGFWREVSAGLKPCDDCRGAYNQAARRKRAAKKGRNPPGSLAAK